MNVWNEEAATFAEHWAGMAGPAQRAVADALGISDTTRLLDVGCGSGLFCALAAGRGAQVSGIDGASAMIEIASRTAPTADLCVGPLARLPWGEARFDAVTGFNCLQFADDPAQALREWARVTRPGGTIAVCMWGPREECELDVFEAVLRTAPPSPRFCERLLETLADTGLTAHAHESVSVPYEVPDRHRLEPALAFIARGADIPEAEALALLMDAAEPFRRAGGSYRF